MSRLASKKFQDLDVVTNNVMTTVPIFYRKKGNTIGEFFMETFIWDHPLLGKLTIPGCSAKAPCDIETHINRCLALKTPETENLKFTKYARKQSITESQLEDCLRFFSIDRTPLIKNFIFVAKDSKGRFWIKLSINDTPKPIDETTYKNQIMDFCLYDEEKEEKLLEVVAQAKQDYEQRLSEWKQKYAPLIERKHNECTGTALSSDLRSDDSQDSWVQLINTYS